MLEVRELSFPERLHPITLTCYPGEIHAILGSNGSGKTTLLKALLGLLPVPNNRVLWRGEPLLQKTRLEISRIVAWLPQQLQIPFEYTVEEFVGMGRYAHGDRGSLEPYLLKTDLLAWRHRLVHSLSQGEKQRAYFARALATEASVLLLDEPQAHLDLTRQRQFWTLLTRLAEEGKIILVANHDLHSSHRYCTHATILERGQCVAQGPVLTLDIPRFFA